MDKIWERLDNQKDEVCEEEKKIIIGKADDALKSKLFMEPYSKLPTDNTEEDINEEIKKKIKAK